MSGAPGAKPTISDAPPMRVFSFTFELLELRCKALADFLGGWPTPSWRGQVKGHRRSGRSRRKAP